MVKFMETVLKFIASTKFYLPIIYISVGIILYSIIASTINKLNKININLKNHNNKGLDKRRTTVVSLINNIIKYVILIIVLIMILNLYGINTTTIIASLGAISVIIGLAFQDIIKDLLAGIFIILDNSYAVGDWVEINGFKGEVVSFGLKTTKIRAYTGETKILSNSSFTEVINYNLSHSKLIINIPVSYDIDISKLENILEASITKIKKINNVYNSKLLGVDSFAESAIMYSLEVECAPNTHIGIKRQTLKIIKEDFDKNKIVIPYNQLDVHIEK